MLETPQLAAQVRALPGRALGKLIEHVGLEDAGELVALATTEQLAQIFEEDLWKSARTGEDERFDSERFLLWLEVMLEGGERFVAERLAELPRELLTLALHRHVLVLTEGRLRDELCAGDDEAEAAEKAFESCLSEELDEYQLIWRGGQGWDEVLSALLALDRDHHGLTMALLERCADLSSEYIDDNGGLYQVLSSEDMLEQDLAGERETRRAELGYVAPSSAAAFLRLACATGENETPFSEHDPLTRAYFRQLSREPAAKRTGKAGSTSRPSELLRLLGSAGVTDADPLALREPARLGKHRPEQEEREEREELLVSSALRLLGREDVERFAERSEELAYLTNVLLVGCSLDGRAPQPLEAVELTLAAVSLGLRLAGDDRPHSVQRAAQELARHPCDGLLRLAFRRARLFPSAPDGWSEADAALWARVSDLLSRLKV